MTQKSILITGCSTGIGYHAAHALQKRGWQVFASCRKKADCDRLKSEGLTSPLIDYQKPTTIKSGLKQVLKATDGRLDALFNNGAFANPGAVEDLPTDALRAIFEANFFGWHELTRQVIPVMRAGGNGRIVQCSSVLGMVALPYRGAYNSTKFALEGLNDTMRLEMKGTGIDVISVQPGPIATKIRVNAQAHFKRWIDWENSPRRKLYEKGLMPRLYAPEGGPKDFGELECDAVTKKLIHALESRRPKPRYYITTPTYIMGALRRVLPTRALDWVARKG